jgi:hypothetical protein
MKSSKAEIGGSRINFRRRPLPKPTAGRIDVQKDMSRDVSRDTSETSLERFEAAPVTEN